MRTRSVRRLSTVVLGLCTLLGGGCAEDDGNVAPVSSQQYYKVSVRA